MALRQYVTYRKFLLSKSAPKLRYQGEVLSLRDAKTVIFAYATWTSIIADSHRFRSCGFVNRHASAANIKRLQRWLLCTDVKLVFDQLDILKRVFQECIGKNRRAWKLTSRELGLDTSTELYRLVYPLLLTSCEDESEAWLRHLNTVVTFPKRVSLEGSNQLVQEAFNSYLLDEEYLARRDRNLSTEEHRLLEKLRKRVYHLWKDWKPIHYKAHHGSGATAEVPRSGGTNRKYCSIEPNEQLVNVLQLMDYQPNNFLFGRVNYPWALQENYPNLAKLAYGDMPVDCTPCYWDTVPKNASKRRCISLETSWRAFCQKLVGDSMKHYMAKKPEFHVDLFDQEKNRSLCRLGSIDGKFVTGDLSSASDLVRLSTILYIFQDLPLLTELLVDTRSTHVSFTRTGLDMELYLHKYAPMGSAMCFPAMCTLLSAVIAQAYDDLGLHDDYRVYGDDIILRIEAWLLVIRYLELLGLRVNRDKSFDARTLYRESCGIECFKGMDITPLKISQLFQPIPEVNKGKVRRSVEHLEGCVSLANRLFDYGYNHKPIARLLRAVYPYVAFSHNGVHGVRTKAAVLNAHLVCEDRPFAEKSDPIPMVRTYVVASKQQDVSDDLRYGLWLEQAQFRSKDYRPVPEDWHSVRGGKADARLKVAWVPVFWFEDENVGEPYIAGGIAVPS